jgi:hypothetical protein
MSESKDIVAQLFRAAGGRLSPPGQITKGTMRLVLAA